MSKFLQKYDPGLRTGDGKSERHNSTEGLTDDERNDRSRKGKKGARASNKAQDSKRRLDEVLGQI